MVESSNLSGATCMTVAKILSKKKAHKDRVIDSQLVVDCLSLAENSVIRNKVIDSITIYKAALEIRETLPHYKISICDQFLDELESSLFCFLETGKIPKRNLSFSQITLGM